MNVKSFLEHYNIIENPFRAEEARQDSVFSRVETACHHPDYEKIRGDFDKPASSIVFGERGSGKTAIRLQIEDELREHNRAHPESRCLAIVYDELNPVLDRFSRRVGRSGAMEVLNEFALIDHIDAIMNAAVPGLISQMLGDAPPDAGPLHIDDDVRRKARSMSASAKQDLMVLQVCYDRPHDAGLRTARLKRAIRFHSRNHLSAMKWGAGVVGVFALAVMAYLLIWKPEEQMWLWYTALALLALGAIALGIMALVQWFGMNQLARDLSINLRVMDRPTMSYRTSLRSLNPKSLREVGLPRNNDDDLRYAMFGRLLNVLRQLGYKSILVLVDRIDEPTMINGEPDRMRALVWPMLNNKFLQQDGAGFKMLLPLELRYLLNRETGDFFREARLDKQNLIERLTWSGATLYDLCTARINACRAANAETISLTDLFAADVTYQDLVDALDQMQQPRDAFKFVYQLIQEHCSNVPEEHPQWKIPRPVLDAIRKREVERMTGMLRGVRPG